MKRIALLSVVVAVCGFVLTGCPQGNIYPGYGCDVTIHNNSSEIIYSFYIGTSGDQLPYSLYPGDSYTVYGVPWGFYDLYAETYGGSVYWWRYNTDLRYDTYDWYLWDKKSEGKAANGKGNSDYQENVGAFNPLGVEKVQ